MRLGLCIHESRLKHHTKQIDKKLCIRLYFCQNSTTNSSIHSQPCQIRMINPRALSNESSFIQRACKLQNFLSSPSFPESYYFSSLKIERIDELDLRSFNLFNSFFFFGDLYRPGLSPTKAKKDCTIDINTSNSFVLPLILFVKSIRF